MEKDPQFAISCLYEISTRSGFGKKVISIIRDENLMALLFGSAVEAAKSPRRNIIFNPIPPSFVKFRNEKHAAKITNEYAELIIDTKCRRSMERFDKLVKESEKNYTLIDEILNTLNKSGVSSYVSKLREIYDKFLPENDDEFRRLVIGENSDGDHTALLFDFMRFAVMNNKLTLQRNDIVIGDPSLARNAEPQQVNAKMVHKFQQYEVIHTKDAEVEFDSRRKTMKSCFLFHGSGKQNWYSLMCNGIKVASNTKLMTTGAAYGVGVYASDTLAVSYGYSGYGGVPTSSDANSSDTLSNNQIVAVYEILGNKETYKKSNSIYVINDDTLLIIRYLIAIPTQSSQALVNDVSSKSILDSIAARNVVIQKNFTRGMVGWRRRISEDLKKAARNPAITIYYFSGEKKIQFNPKVHNAKKIMKANAGAPQTTTFLFDVKDQSVEVKFPLEYPATAPIINRSSNSNWELQSDLGEYVINIRY